MIPLEIINEISLFVDNETFDNMLLLNKDINRIIKYNDNHIKFIKMKNCKKMHFSFLKTRCYIFNTCYNDQRFINKRNEIRFVNQALLLGNEIVVKLYYNLHDIIKNPIIGGDYFDFVSPSNYKSVVKTIKNYPKRSFKRFGRQIYFDDDLLNDL